MLNERRRAATAVAAHFLKAEAAADEAAMLASECVSVFLRQRLAANLPVGTGIDALQLLSDAASDMMRARHRMVAAHKALVETRGAIGLRAFGDEGCPPVGDRRRRARHARRRRVRDRRVAVTDRRPPPPLPWIISPPST